MINWRTEIKSFMRKMSCVSGSDMDEITVANNNVSQEEGFTPPGIEGRVDVEKWHEEADVLYGDGLGVQVEEAWACKLRRVAASCWSRATVRGVEAST
jgi:hypothetical protein